MLDGKKSEKGKKNRKEYKIIKCFVFSQLSANMFVRHIY